MEISTTRFGPVTVDEGEIYLFPEGLLGFPGISRYVLLPHPRGGLVSWLQAVDVPDLAFLVCPPQAFKPDYRVGVRPEDLALLGLSGLADGLVLVILSVQQQPKCLTANLKGPLIFNPARRLAKQQVLDDYDVRYQVA